MASPLTFQLFAKAPVAGQVKTRLSPALDPAAAAALHARMVAHAAGAVAAACALLPQARGELWCSPDTTDATLTAIAGRHGLALRAQPAGDLGLRMQVALESALPGRVVLLGSDCPALDAPLLCAAAAALEASDAVFVPVEDGGYALVGCRDRAPACFAGMTWSTGTVMRQTRVRLEQSGMRWVELPMAWDVDSAADLARLEADVRFSQLLAGLKPQGAALA